MDPGPTILRDQSFVHHGRKLVYDVYEPAPPGRSASTKRSARQQPADEHPTVVYLHGLLLDSEMNRGIAEALSWHGRRVVLLDLLGHGRSDRPTHASEYRMDSYADQVVALLDHLSLPTAVLGGLSLGANVSLLTATTHPDRVAGLILEMPVLEWAVPSAALAFVPLVLLTHYVPWPLTVVSAVMRRVPRTPYGMVNSIMDTASTPPEVMSSVLHGVLVGPVAPTVDARRKITAPTLVLAHANDLIHPFDDAASLVTQVPNARLVRARSPLELRLFPNRLTSEIVEFVGGIASPDAGRTAPATKSVSRRTPPG